jgi:hypothetical protein
MFPYKNNNNHIFMTILRLIRRVHQFERRDLNKQKFLTYYMLRFVQIRNNRYENRLIFLLLANKNIVFP